jgi:hypothetical protein
MIRVLEEKVNPEQLREMLEVDESMIKIVVDLRQNRLAGGGEMHADGVRMLLETGSEQDDLWGANWYPEEQRITYESLINIRPRMGNRSILIEAEALRQQVAAITRQILGDVHA